MKPIPKVAFIIMTLASLVWCVWKSTNPIGRDPGILLMLDLILVVAGTILVERAVTKQLWEDDHHGR